MKTERVCFVVQIVLNHFRLTPTVFRNQQKSRVHHCWWKGNIWLLKVVRSKKLILQLLSCCCRTFVVPNIKNALSSHVHVALDSVIASH